MDGTFRGCGATWYDIYSAAVRRHAFITARQSISCQDILGHVARYGWVCIANKHALMWILWMNTIRQGMERKGSGIPEHFYIVYRILGFPLRTEAPSIIFRRMNKRIRYMDCFRCKYQFQGEEDFGVYLQVVTHQQCVRTWGRPLLYNRYTKYLVLYLVISIFKKLDLTYLVCHKSIPWLVSLRGKSREGHWTMSIKIHEAWAMINKLQIKGRLKTRSYSVIFGVKSCWYQNLMGPPSRFASANESIHFWVWLCARRPKWLFT